MIMLKKHNHREDSMRKLAILFALVVAAISTTSFVTPAFAQATRTWVSGVGDDANPCSRTAPCKTFAGAISKTAAKGEINVLDPGGFGAVTITKSITIRSDHIEAGVLVGSGSGVVVNAAATDRIVLEGLDFEGLGVATHGVNFLAGKELYIIRCTFRDFTGNALNQTSASPGAHSFINDSFLLFNTGGVNVAAAGVASITNTSILSNTSFAVQANNAGAIIGVQSSVLNASPAGISNLIGGGQVISVGPSNLVTGAGAFTSTILFK